MPTGPKGVINDWRRFKLESMDQENVPSAKKELLRQMSSPSKSKEDSRANLNRKVPSAWPQKPTLMSLLIVKCYELYLKGREVPRFLAL